MNDVINALEVTAELDLAAFCQYLRRSGVRFRVSEEGLNQIVWVGSLTEATFVQEAFVRFTDGELVPPPVEPSAKLSLGRRLFGAVYRFPMTLGLIVVTLALFPAGMNIDGSDIGPLLRALMFLSTEQVMGNYYFSSLTDTLAAGEYWRLLTPMFIHFSVLHIVFNLLWVWEIGRRVEVENGVKLYLGLVMISSLASNLLQFAMTGPVLFGGMSGVVFGLLGFAFIWSRLVPERSLRVQNGIYIFMLIYLALGFSGLIDMLGLGSLANGAHLGGLLGGLVTGGLAGLLARLKRPGSSA